MDRSEVACVDIGEATENEIEAGSESCIRMAGGYRTETGGSTVGKEPGRGHNFAADEEGPHKSTGTESSG